MKKSEIKKATDNELIYALVNVNAQYSVNINLGGGVKDLSNRLIWLTDEMVKRKLLTEEQQHHLLHD